MSAFGGKADIDWTCSDAAWGRPLGEALQPAPHMRAVAAVDVTELELEVGFFASHYTVADDEREGRERQRQP